MSENFLQTPTFKAPLPKSIAAMYPPKVEKIKAMPTVSIPDEAKSSILRKKSHSITMDNHQPYYSQPPYYYVKSA